MKILICGDRDWTHWEPIHNFIDGMAFQEGEEHLVIITGGARGADTIARDYAESLGIKTLTFPAEWDKYGRERLLVCNQKMLEAGPDKVFAFHNDIANSKGTKDMVNRARKAGIPTTIMEAKW